MPFFSVVVHFVGLDPRIATRLIDPEDATPSLEDLVAKYLESAISVTVSSRYGNSSRNVVVSRIKIRLYPNFFLETFSTS